jgi:flagellar biosynthesis/type III secretory pathway ATPase
MKGYTPSVFANLSRLLERAGTGTQGTITAFYTVLVESDDLTEPVTDTVRGTLDGHIVLSRELAAENHYPAIDVMQSVSRVMPAITTREHRDAAARMRELLARYRRSRDLVTIGAYQHGSDPGLDEALGRLPAIEAFLRQRPDEPADLASAIAGLSEATGLAGSAGIGMTDVAVRVPATMTGDA